MPSATYYAWKAKFGGLEVSDAKRLRALEEGSARLKRLLSDDAGQRRPEGPAIKKWRRLPRSGKQSRIFRRRWGWAGSGRVLSSERARTSMRYRSCRVDDGDLRSRLRELAEQRRRFGYRRMHILLRQDGITINRKKTQRLYREEDLTVRRRNGRKRAVGARAPATVLALPNQRWSLDPSKSSGEPSCSIRWLRGGGSAPSTSSTT